MTGEHPQEITGCEAQAADQHVDAASDFDVGTTMEPGDAEDVAVEDESLVDCDNAPPAEQLEDIARSDDDHSEASLADIDETAGELPPGESLPIAIDELRPVEPRPDTPEKAIGSQAVRAAVPVETEPSAPVAATDVRPSTGPTSPDVHESNAPEITDEVTLAARVIDNSDDPEEAAAVVEAIDTPAEQVETENNEVAGQVGRFMDEGHNAIVGSDTYPLHSNTIALSIAGLLQEGGEEPYILELRGDGVNSWVMPRVLEGKLDPYGPWSYHWVAGSGETVYDPIAGGPLDKTTYLERFFTDQLTVVTTLAGERLNGLLQEFYWKYNAATRHDLSGPGDQVVRPDAALGTLAYINSRPPAYLFAAETQPETHVLLNDRLETLSTMLASKNAAQLKEFFRETPGLISRAVLGVNAEADIASAHDQILQQRLYGDDVAIWTKPPEGEQLEEELIDTLVDLYCADQIDATRLGLGMYFTEVLLQKYVDGNIQAARAMELLVGKAAAGTHEVTELETLNLLSHGAGKQPLESLHTLQPDMTTLLVGVILFARGKLGRAKATSVKRHEHVTPLEVIADLAETLAIPKEQLLTEFMRFLVVDSDLTWLDS